MTLAAGALFGLGWGLLLVSFASSVGATLAFLAARYFLRDWVTDRLGDRARAVNACLARDGAFYLFTLRLIPVVPFVLVNLAMGLTRDPRGHVLPRQIAATSTTQSRIPLTPRPEHGGVGHPAFAADRTFGSAAIARSRGSLASAVQQLSHEAAMRPIMAGSPATPPSDPSKAPHAQGTHQLGATSAAAV